MLVAPDARAALEVMEMESGSTGLLEQPREDRAPRCSTLGK